MSIDSVIYVTLWPEMCAREDPRLLLAGCPLFRDLPPGAIDRICSRYHIGVRHHGAGSVIKLRGEVYDELLLIASGAVVAYIDDVSGKTLQVETLPAPSVVASAIFFAALNRLPVSISATEPTTLFAFSKPTVLAIAREHESFLAALLTDMGDRAGFLAARLRMTQFAKIEQKLAVYLWDLVKHQGRDRVTLPHTKQQISEIFGVTRPALSRVFAELADRGVITYDTHTVTVTDRDALEDLRLDVQ